MPGVPHETMVLMLREHPEWLATLVAAVVHRALPDELTVIDSALRVVDPAEVRVDLVLVAENGEWVLVEVQLDIDDVKARKWPLALAALWNERDTPGDLFVITPSRAVAEWALSVGRMTGPRGSRLTAEPVVVQLTGDVAELLLDPAHPEMAFFAVWTVHDRYGPEARAIVEGAAELIELIPDEALRRTLMRLMIAMLHERLIQTLRKASMDLNNLPLSDALRRWNAEYEAMHGLRIRLEESSKMLLKVLAARRLPVDDAAQARIQQCTDLATVERWVESAVTAATTDDVFRA